MLAILEEKIEGLRSDRRTPVESFPAPSESSDHIRQVAGEVTRGQVTTHTLDCLMPGGALREVTDKMEKRIMTVDAKVQEHEMMIHRIAGALGLTKVVVPLSAFVVIITTIIKFYMEMRGHK